MGDGWVSWASESFFLLFCILASVFLHRFLFGFWLPPLDPSARSALVRMRAELQPASDDAESGLWSLETNDVNARSNPRACGIGGCATYNTNLPVKSGDNMFASCRDNWRNLWVRPCFSHSAVSCSEQESKWFLRLRLWFCTMILLLFPLLWPRKEAPKRWNLTINKPALPLRTFCTRFCHPGKKWISNFCNAKRQVIYKIREWTEDGELWVQYVSSRKASRADVIQLQVMKWCQLWSNALTSANIPGWLEGSSFPKESQGNRNMSYPRGNICSSFWCASLL